MPHPIHDNRINGTKPRIARQAATSTFRGFASPRSNTTYTPNQFFDVCIPHSSRGVVRLVAYMIRKTLGWCDAEGNPQEEQIAVSYQELVNRAGISREMIRQALDEAIAGRFIRCVREGRSKREDDAGQTARFELCWDDSGEYVKDPKRFRGFFEAEGNRTDIPNEFFDRIIPQEPLSVIKTVAAVIRFSIGFQARRGVRRQQVQLSYSHIQRYARIASRTTLTDALETALSRNYIVRLADGIFDPDAGRLSRAAVYGVKWADGFGTAIGQTTEPEKAAPDTDHRSENRTGEQSEIRTGNGQKTGPAERSENQTGIEMKQINNTFKQQAAAGGILELSSKLQQEGFDAKTAGALATAHPKKRIEEQIQWLPSRTPTRNRIGMLRKAIEENWPEPSSASANDSRGAIFASHFYAAIAGNHDAPIAEPSTKDMAIAERFLDKIERTGVDNLNPVELGRAFGRMTAEDSPALARGGMSLTLAVRLRGDGFYSRHLTAIKSRRERAERSAREAHEKGHCGDWLDFVKSELNRITAERPKDIARFDEHRADERRRMIESPWAVFTEERLARFDGEDRRARDFQKFFADEVLDFWNWDALMNPAPFAWKEEDCETLTTSE